MHSGVPACQLPIRKLLASNNRMMKLAHTYIMHICTVLWEVVYANSPSSAEVKASGWRIKDPVKSQTMCMYIATPWFHHRLSSIPAMYMY